MQSRLDRYEWKQTFHESVSESRLGRLIVNRDYRQSNVIEYHPIGINGRRSVTPVFPSRRIRSLQRWFDTRGALGLKNTASLFYDVAENKLPVKIVYLVVPIACKQVLLPAAAKCCEKQMVMKAEIVGWSGCGAIWFVFDDLMLCLLVAVVIVLIVNDKKCTTTDI